MQQAILKRINLIEEKIKNSLENEDFIAVSALSKEFDNLIHAFSDTINSETDYSKHAEELDRLLNTLSLYEKQTSKIFKDYTSKVSNQTKMHNAYKKYSG